MSDKMSEKSETSTEALYPELLTQEEKNTSVVT